jgi:hypothetical protein
LEFEDLRHRKTYSGTGLLLWEGFDRLRLRVYSPIGTTVADLAIRDSAMALAIYHPTSEKRFLRGPVGTIERPSAEFIERAGAFSALRPEHLLAALRIPDKDYLMSEQEWRDAKGRLAMNVSYKKSFRKAGLLWAREIVIKRPIDGYTLKLNLYPDDMKIGERLPENAFRLEPDGNLPVVTLSR